MNSDVLQALIASGASPANAQRIAQAIDAAYGAPPRSPLPSQAQGDGVNAAGFDVYAQGSAQLIDAIPQGRFAGGKGALGVNGLAYFQGDAYFKNGFRAGGGAFDGNISVRGGVQAGDAYLRSISLHNGVQVGGGAAVFPVPLVANAPLISRQGGEFSGDNLFAGPVSFGGPVYWGGQERRPGNVSVVTLATGGNDTVNIQTANVAVLNDYGDSQSNSMRFTLGTTNGVSVMTTVAPTTATLNCITAVTTASVSCCTSEIGRAHV